MADHTKGPWLINYTTIDGVVVRWHIAGPQHGSVYPICEHVLEEQPSATEQLANAELITKAPELLAAHEMNKTIRDSIDRLLAEAMFSPESSIRHKLAMMYFPSL